VFNIVDKKNMITVKNISFNYEKTIIFNNFTHIFAENSKTVVIGESGRGKTTLLNLLLGFEVPDKGEIFFDNVLLNQETIGSIRQKIAWLPQNFNVPFDSVGELFNSIFELKINRKKKISAIEIQDIFSELGIETELLNKKIGEISGGQKQRVILAALVLSDKKHIFLDEPSSALDEISTKKIIELLWKNKNSTVIIVSHDKLFAEKADFVLNL